MADEKSDDTIAKRLALAIRERGITQGEVERRARGERHQMSRINNVANGLCRDCDEPRVTAYHCDRHRIAFNAWHQARRAKLVAAGRCIQCSKPCAEGKKYCKRHLRRASVVNRIRASEAKALGMCSQCCKEHATIGVLCNACHDRARKSANKLREKKIANGLCARCNEPRVNATHCEAHRAKVNAVSAAAKKKKVAKRRKAGLCALCGAPSKGYYYCKTHREANRVRALKWLHEKNGGPPKNGEPPQEGKSKPGPKPESTDAARLAADIARYSATGKWPKISHSPKSPRNIAIVAAWEKDREERRKKYLTPEAMERSARIDAAIVAGDLLSLFAALAPPRAPAKPKPRPKYNGAAARAVAEIRQKRAEKKAA